MFAQHITIKSNGVSYYYYYSYYSILIFLNPLFWKIMKTFVLLIFITHVIRYIQIIEYKKRVLNDKISF